MLSAIKYGCNDRNGGAQIDGRNMLHTSSILRLLKVFWYYSEYSQYSQYKYSQYQPDEILSVFDGTRSTDPEILEVQKYSTSRKQSIVQYE